MLTPGTRLLKFLHKMSLLWHSTREQTFRSSEKGGTVSTRHPAGFARSFKLKFHSRRLSVAKTFGQAFIELVLDNMDAFKHE
jgi:hypothetical protein